MMTGGKTATPSSWTGPKGLVSATQESSSLTIKTIQPLRSRHPMLRPEGLQKSLHPSPPQCTWVATASSPPTLSQGPSLHSSAPSCLLPPGPTLSMKEANLLLRVLICSRSSVRTRWISGSISTWRGVNRLWLTVTCWMPPGGQTGPSVDLLAPRPM